MRNGSAVLNRIFSRRFPVSISIRQMWLQNRIQSSLNALSSLSRSRKIILLVLVLLLLVYYLVPTLFNLTSPKIHLALEDCLEEKIHKSFFKSSESLDVVINHRPLLPGETAYPIYVGNGKVAAAFDSQNGLFIRLNRALSLPVKFYPVVQTQVDGEPSREAFAVDMKAGVAYRMQTVKRGWNCVSIGSKLYAHRSHPSVLVQDIRIQNPTQSAVTVELDQIGPSGWTDSKTQQFLGKTSTGENVSYKVTTGIVQIPESTSVVAAAIGMVYLDSGTVTVQPDRTKLYHILTVVHYTKPADKHEVPHLVPDLLSQVKIDMEKGLNIDGKLLLQEHTRVWASLWQSGFGISYSKAGGALNGDKINSTIYFVLSNVPAPLHDPSTTKAQRINIQKVLYYPDRCYGEHSTLQADKLWIDVEDEDQIARVVTTWMITLEKQGCAVMVQSGAEGVLQAMMLSFGALRFHNSHLEMAIHPKDLHRDFFFRRINYGNNTHVNISVTVGEDNKANLYVALDRNDKPYYACDAGCLDAPVPLGKEWQRFPVKLTDPLTSILYITADKIHVEELKHAIHVKAIEEAPAHEHHVIALHRHGHHFGGLPTLFWVSIAFLIIIFHLFLFKLIYNEYCQGQDRYARSKYNL
ncbi:uncharacterized protein KIAA2013 homolog [Haliotis rufescens]|uniref:uncharacterized protein KIAA2013 homolog n=1 Tax=Haliotis rufescens TaxID=6454 RepID=UPI001EB0A10C|nr:uncharacterized protein KIAA2013 homolog [Haliotis rufescens]